MSAPSLPYTPSGTFSSPCSAKWLSLCRAESNPFPAPGSHPYRKSNRKATFEKTNRAGLLQSGHGKDLGYLPEKSLSNRPCIGQEYSRKGTYYLCCIRWKAESCGTRLALFIGGSCRGACGWPMDCLNKPRSCSSVLGSIPAVGEAAAGEGSVGRLPTCLPYSAISPPSRTIAPCIENCN